MELLEEDRGDASPVPGYSNWYQANFAPLKMADFLPSLLG